VIKANHPDPRTEQMWEHCQDVRDSLLMKLRDLDVALEAAWPLLNDTEYWDEVLTQVDHFACQWSRVNV